MAEPVICPKFEKAILLLSKRWTALVIYQLLNGTQRFNEIQSAIGISGKVLSDRLKDLEQERSEEHTSELQSRPHLVCRLLLEKKKKKKKKKNNKKKKIKKITNKKNKKSYE